MALKLEGKIAVITGGDSGIGLASAKRFVDEGAYVFITGRRQSELDKARANIGKNVTAVQGDVSKMEDLDRLFDLIKIEKDKLDIVMANAGIVERFLMADATLEHFEKTININVKGTYFTVQKALPLLQEGSSVILITSILNSLGIPEHSVYAATKAAVRSLARTFTAELKDRKIRVNSLSPGPVDTPIIDGQTETKEGADAIREMYASMNPMGRIGRSEELAAAALFLASDESSFTNGIELVVDG
jgi:NAD(P)-dependent dehydrogenase (short-subunit alcohol dehydrogenase family)